MSHINKPEVVICQLPFGEKNEMEALQKIKEIGTTSVQIYTFWKDFEPNARGEFNFEHFDRQVKLIKEAGLKYVPFLLIGPKYAAPEWWLKSDEHRGLCCLEHNKYSPIESIWNENFKKEISRVLKAFADHYVPMNVIESVQPGICGDYGEAIFPVQGNWPGDYHTHQGYWCGDADAIKSFRDWLHNKYANVEALNKAWRANYRAIDEIVPLLPHKYPSRTAYFDFVEWYRYSMTDFAEFWLKECKKAFGDIPVYLCTGGLEEPEHGSLFSTQAKIAGRNGCGIRLTNEVNKFYDNFFWTAYTKNACEYYGAYMGLEPVGPITSNGIMARIFASAAYGNRQIFHYYYNLIDENDKPMDTFEIAKKYKGLLGERKMNQSAAFFWPEYYSTWNGGMPSTVKDALTFIRKRRNCMPVNEEMIMDGILSKYKILFIAIEYFTSKEALLKIAEWVRNGGILFSAGLPKDIELEDVEEFNQIFGITNEFEQTYGHARQIIDDKSDFNTFVSIKDYPASKAWMNLDKDVVLLSSSIEEEGYSGTTIKKVSSAFYKKNGDGLAIMYTGPLSFEEDSEMLFADNGVFKALLNDIVNNYSDDIDLGAAQGEIVRAEIDGVVYALREGQIEVVNSSH